MSDYYLVSLGVTMRKMFKNECMAIELAIPGFEGFSKYIEETYDINFELGQVNKYDTLLIRKKGVPGMNYFARYVLDANEKSCYAMDKNYDIVHEAVKYVIDDAKRAFIKEPPLELQVKKVIYHNPATIVYWKDGTKTVVKKQKGDRWNAEKGLALCFMKKALGNSSRIFNDMLHEYEEDK